MTVVGKLDEISVSIGELKGTLNALAREVVNNRMAADDRHGENTKALEKISNRVGDLETIVSPLAETVEKIRPIITEYQISRWKLTGAAVMIVAISTGLIWVIDLGWKFYGVMQHKP